MLNRRNAAFALLLAFSAAFWRNSWIITVQLAWLNDAYTYLLLIAPLSLGLVYTQSQEIDPRSKPSPLEGGSFLAAAALLAGIARSPSLPWSGDVRLMLDMLALVMWWVASVIFCFGWKTFRSLLFPLCLLFLTVPLPRSFSEQLIEFLQNQSAFAAFILFRLLGVPVARDGLVLSIPTLNIEVARECSSIRSSLLLVITTIIFAHLFLRSHWRRVVLILAAIPLAIAKNGLRIVVIAELSTRVDPGFLHGNLHRHGGLIFLGISVAAMVGLLSLLRWTEVRRAMARWS